MVLVVPVVVVVSVTEELAPVVHVAGVQGHRQCNRVNHFYPAGHRGYIHKAPSITRIADLLQQHHECSRHLRMAGV